MEAAFASAMGSASTSAVGYLTTALPLLLAIPIAGLAITFGIRLIKRAGRAA